MQKYVIIEEKYVLSVMHNITVLVMWGYDKIATCACLKFTLH